MGFIEDKKSISRRIKQILNENGLKKLRVRSGKGTTYNWIYVWCSDEVGRFSEEEREKLKEIFGESGCSNVMSNTVEGWDAKIGKYESRDFVNSEKYKRLREKFREVGLTQYDGGTCVLGSGTYVIKDGKRIDFIRQLGQGETRSWYAEEKLKDEFAKQGLVLVHEGGVMD